MNESVLVVLTFVERLVVCEERVNVMLVCVTSRECIDLRGRTGCLVACSIRLCLSRRHRRWATQKCHRIRSSSRGVAWFLLSTMCVVERGMCPAKGCGIFMCGF